MKQSCHVADEQCVAPANLESKYLPNRIGTCFSCGLPVCRKCSKIMIYYRYGRKRICNNCIEQYKRDKERFTAVV